MTVYQGRAAVVRTAGGPFLIEDVATTFGRDDDVLVRIVAAGICHTDIIMRDQLFAFPLPGILGHEGAGIVEAVGAAVTSVAPGDHVVLSYMSCGTCRTCLRHEPAYCETFVALNVAGGRADGTSSTCAGDGERLHDHFFGQSSFATFALAQSRNVIKVRKDVPLEILGPLGCGIQTGAGAVLRSLAIPRNSTIAIFGAGGVGLSAVMAARFAGARIIVAVDPVASRRSLAAELGATHCLDPAGQDPAAAIRELTGGSGADFSLEMSGNPRVLRQAIDCLAARGVCGIVGAPPAGAEASFDVSFVMLAGRVIRGICEGDSDPQLFIPELIELFVQGAFPFDRLLSFYPFERINEAVADALAGTAIKPVLKLSSKQGQGGVAPLAAPPGSGDTRPGPLESGVP